MQPTLFHHGLSCCKVTFRESAYVIFDLFAICKYIKQIYITKS